MQTTKRILMWAGLALTLFAGLLLWLWATADPMAVAFARIQKGMSLEEVQAIVGRPQQCVAAGGIGEDSRSTLLCEWYGEGSTLRVSFWRDGVEEKEHVSLRESFLDQLRRWLRLT